MRRRDSHHGRPLSEGQVLDGIRGVVADYPNAPADIRDYTWVLAPRYWDRYRVPGGKDIEPRHQDHHGGVSFRVGWSVPDRTVAIWFG